MSLLDKASLVMTPNAVKATKVYSVIPSNGNGDMTFSRGTPASATRTNSNGVIENVAIDVPRLNYDTVGGCPSLLLEPQRTNRLLNSDIVVTQTIATTGVACAVSFYGTGTITFSGTFVGSLVGTGVNNRVSIVFTPTSGNLILTVSGSCTKGQLETGAYPTTYIPTTTGTVTRVADTMSRNNIFTNGLITAAGGTWFFELNNNISLVRESASNGIRISDTLNFLSGNGIYIRNGISTASTLMFFKYINGSPNFLYTLPFTTSKIAIKWNGLTADFFVNGTKVISATSFLTTNMDFLNVEAVDVPKYIKSMLLFPTSLTDTECTNLTTL